MTTISPFSDWLSVTALSALALPGIGGSRSGVLRNAQKNGWRSRLVPGAGGMHYEFHIRSLPREALETYAERLLGPDVVRPLKQLKDSFTAGLKRFQRDIMEARALILAEIDALVETGLGRSNAIEHFVGLAQSGELPSPVIKHLSIANARSGARNSLYGFTRTISRSTLYLWLKERAMRGIAALAPKSIFRSPYIPDWAPTVMKLYGQPQKPSLAYVMEILPDILSSTIHLPSYGQVSRFFKRLSTQVRHQGRMGPNKLKAMKAYIQRDVSELWPGAVYAADGHRFDAEVAHPRHGRPFRPEITSVIDVYSRKVVGWSIALEEDTWGVLDAARHAFETNGVPDIWYVDNGKGFNNKNWDDDLTGFITRLGITKKNSLPYNSQARGVIERLHQSLWVRSAKTLVSYMGKDMDVQARRQHYKVTRQDIKKYGTTPHIMSWSDFMNWAGQQVDAYNGRPHSFLPRIRDHKTYKRRHMTPEEAWALGIKDKDAPLALSPAQQEDITRPYIKRRTNRALVNLFGNRYYAPELEGYHGEDVLVGYDIHDATQVWIRDLDHRLISIALFEGNKQSFFPVDVAHRAHEEKLARQLKNIGGKRDLVRAEQEELQYEKILKPVFSLDDNGDSKEMTRPTFDNRGDWVRWIIDNPAQVTGEDKHQIRNLKHHNSFILLLDTLDIPLSLIEELLR